jgi:hypothetical protein
VGGRNRRRSQQSGTQSVLVAESLALECMGQSAPLTTAPFDHKDRDDSQLNATTVCTYAFGSSPSQQ